YVLMRGLVPTSNVAKIFSDFITAKDKDELWRARNKAKRLWLLNKLATSNFSDQQITGACLEVISSDHEKEYKPAALLTVARIDPTNSVLTELEKIPKPSVETIMAALKISEALKQNPEAGDAPLKLVKFVAHHSRLLIQPRYRPPPEDRARPDYNVVFVDIELERARPVPIESTILFEGEDRWSKTIDDVLKDYVQQDDLGEFRDFVHWLTMEESGHYRIGVKLLLSENSRITLQNGKVEKASAPDGVTLLREDKTKDGKPSEQMTASWTDPEKGKTSGIVTGFENPKDLTFKR